MKESSSAHFFNELLAEVQSLQADYLAEKEPIDPGPEPEAVRRFGEALKARYDSEGRRGVRSRKVEPDYEALSMADKMWMTLSGMAEQREHPFEFSGLSSYLELETWQPREALLILAGVEPHAALVDWNYDNFMGAKIQRPVIRRATWFADVADHYDQPLASDMEKSPAELRSELRVARLASSERVKKLEAELEDAERWANDPTSQYVQQILSFRSEMLHHLTRLWFSADHDSEARRSPEFFVRWAESRGFDIEWTTWAREQGLIEQEPPITAPPFFDADAEDYPELLHIAVRAWDHARKSASGTPKQRIAAFVAERYPHVSDGAKEAIALIANWQKAGGRPKTGG